MKLDHVPTSIPKAQEKKALLDGKNIPNVYLGQGLMFVPPESAKPDYEKYLQSQGIDPKDYPLDILRRAGKGGEVYNSPVAEEMWNALQNTDFWQTPNGLVPKRKPEAFQKVSYNEISGETIENFFGIDGNEIATMQANNLQDGLNKIRSILAHLAGDGQYLSRVILPAKYKYSGHTDFVDDAKLVGGDIDTLEIPEIQEDGDQDLQAMRRKFQKVKDEGRIAIVIDQEMNNNASGWDRNPKLNEEFASLLKEFEGTIFYVGDIAYKGMKEDILEPYPLMQELVKKDVSAFYYFSPTKLTCYRKPPSFKSIVFATPGDVANTKDLRTAFKKSQRAPGGIGCTNQGAVWMNQLSKNLEFHQEVRTLRLYLKYILDSIDSKTNGIFRCRDMEIIQQLNSGNPQVITVGPRENIWPLGDPEIRKLYNEALGCSVRERENLLHLARF